MSVLLACSATGLAGAIACIISIYPHLALQSAVFRLLAGGGFLELREVEDVHVLRPGQQDQAKNPSVFLVVKK